MLESEALKQVEIQLAKLDGLNYTVENSMSEIVRQVKRIKGDLERQKQIILAEEKSISQHNEKYGGVDNGHKPGL